MKVATHRLNGSPARQWLSFARPAVVGLLVALCFFQTVSGAPFNRNFKFKQPDGTPVELWGKGDQFRAVFETLDGYTVVPDPATRAYCFARLAADGTLASTGVAIHQGDPTTLGLEKHLRMDRALERAQADQRRQEWDQALNISQRWNDLKAQARQRQAAIDSGALSAPPPGPTVGVKAGLTLLVDFSDETNTVPQSEMLAFCNADNYTGFGNYCSVKKYYQDNSNNRLTYTNYVSVYLHLPNPKSYYDDSEVDEGTQGRLLVADAIRALKALTNYNSTILPSLRNLTTDSAGHILACSVFYAGTVASPWGMGLWPHSWTMASPVSLGSGLYVFNYQVSDIGDNPAIATFCHENGHMLCGYPDIYDYDYDSIGGAGVFCLMNSGTIYDYNPPQICAYLKAASGWANISNITSSTILTGVVTAVSGTNFNTFYKFTNPNASTEYYLIENRQPVAHDINLPAAGIAIWHVDELGDHNDQGTNYNSTHSNYEVTLVQADNLWDFELNNNDGDYSDLYFLGNSAPGYANTFSDASSPSARWWDGSSSGLNISAISAPKNSMSFKISPSIPVIITQPVSQNVALGASATFTVGAISASSMSYQWYFQNLPIVGANNTNFTRPAVTLDQMGGYFVIVSGTYGSVTSLVAQLSVSNSPPVIAGGLTNLVATAGSSPTFAPSVLGSPTLTYQWQYKGTNLLNRTNVSLTLTNVQFGQAGTYVLVASNRLGRVFGTNNLDITPMSTWGYNIAGSTTATNQQDFFGISAALDHVLALRVNGTVVGWGDNEYGQSSVPIGVNNVVSVADGGFHSLALRADGIVMAWGDNSYGQATPPGDLTKVKSIAAGLMHSVALKTDGTVVSWGDNSIGQSTGLSQMTGVAGIAAGWYHSVCLKSNGTAVAVGWNQYQQTNVPPSATNLIAVAAGRYHSLGLRSNGTVVAWGDGRNGQTNVPPTLSNVTAIACGTYHCLALKSDRTVVAWGGNGYGQTNLPPQNSNIVAIACGDANNLALVACTSTPFVVLHPVSYSRVPTNGSLTFKSVANSQPNLTVQWWHNNSIVTNATNTTLVLTNVGTNVVGTYWARFTNSAALAATSSVAFVNLKVSQRFAAPPKHISNGTFPLVFGDSNKSNLLSGAESLFEVWTSTNLVNWENLNQPLVLSNGVMTLSDTNVNAFRQRWYRVLER